MRKALLAVVGVAIFATSGQAQSKIGGIRWELAELNGRKMTISRVFIEFDESARHFSGNAGCNRMFGTYELDGQRFRARQVGTTKMACLDRNVSRAESDLLEALRTADRLRRDGPTLTIRADGQRVLRFQRVGRFDREPATADLTTRKWMLRSIEGKPVPQRIGAFLNFDADKGSAGGDSGCNVFGGEYEALGSSIKFTDIVSTMRACESDNRGAIERGFQGALQVADRFRVDGDRLAIMKGSKVLLEFEGVAK